MIDTIDSSQVISQICQGYRDPNWTIYVGHRVFYLVRAFQSFSVALVFFLFCIFLFFVDITALVSADFVGLFWAVIGFVILVPIIIGGCQLRTAFQANRHLVILLPNGVMEYTKPSNKPIRLYHYALISEISIQVMETGFLSWRPIYEERQMDSTRRVSYSAPHCQDHKSRKIR
jgi:hypothetical protein